jgi:hypothetical protein
MTYGSSSRARELQPDYDYLKTVSVEDDLELSIGCSLPYKGRIQTG